MSSNLKSESFKNCKSLIKEFLDAVPVQDQALKEKKRKARIALEVADKLINVESSDPESDWSFTAEGMVQGFGAKCSSIQESTGSCHGCNMED